MDKKELAAAITRKLASRKVSDSVIAEPTDELFAAGSRPIDIDVCQFGICIDYYVE